MKVLIIRRNRIGAASHQILSFNHYMEQAYLGKSCQSMRLVCKDFSKLHTLNGAVFRTAHVTPSTHSLGRLTEISDHPHIRTFIKHVTFKMPQLPHTLGGDQFDEQLKDRLILDYDYVLKHETTQTKREHRLPLCDEDLTVDLAEPSDCVWPERDERARFLARKYFDTIIPEEKRRGAYEKIVNAIEDQRVLCENGGFARLAGESMAKLPTATSFSICRGYGTRLENMMDEVVGPRFLHSSGKNWTEKKWNHEFVSFPLLLESA
jgi:hypothetical protein